LYPRIVASCQEIILSKEKKRKEIRIGNAGLSLIHRNPHRARRTARPGFLGDSEEYDPDGQQADEAPDDDRFPYLS
jgi:hypothetical protein